MTFRHPIADFNRDDRERDAQDERNARIPAVTEPPRLDGTNGRGPSAPAAPSARQGAATALPGDAPRPHDPLCHPALPPGPSQGAGSCGEPSTPPIEGGFAPTLAGLHDLARQAVQHAPTDRLRDSASVVERRVSLLRAEARSDGWAA